MIAPLLARKDVGDLIQDEDFLILVGLLTATLLVGAFLLGLLERWRKRQLKEDPRDLEQLGSYRNMYERGELSKEEYERIRNKVAVRVKEKTLAQTSPAKPAESPKQEPDPTPPPT